MNKQINNIMQKQHSSQDRGKQPSETSPLVSDAGSIHVSGYVRVFDPNTQEILVEARE